MQVRDGKMSATDGPFLETQALYDTLLRIDASPVVALNRAVAIGMFDGPGAGLAGSDALLASGELEQYSLAHSAPRCSTGSVSSALRLSYQRSLGLARQPAEQRLLQRRLTQLRA